MSRFVAHGLLLLAAFFWGVGNIVQKTALDFIGPLGATGVRCLIAAGILAPLLLFERRAPREPGFVASAVGVGAVFSIGIGLQQAAYQWTTVTNASFLVNVCTVMTPVVAWIVAGRSPSALIWLAAGATLAGAYLMSGATGLTGIGWGDLVCLQSALAYAVWYVLLERHAVRFGRPVATAVVQFTCSAVAFMPLGIVFEGIHLPLDGEGIWHVLALGVVSTAAPYAMLTFAQRHTSASAAAVIVSAEGLFGAVAAILVLGERPAIAAIVGAGLISAAIVSVAIEPAAAVRTKPVRRLPPTPEGVGASDT